jgi:hypothetical protein
MGQSANIAHFEVLEYYALEITLLSEQGLLFNQKTKTVIYFIVFPLQMTK